jgi:DNA-binding transcriptional LysR family regulator
VTLELDLSPRRVDLVAENFDIAIRMGDLPDDSTLAARRVAGAFRPVCGAVYIAQRGLPEHPDDLLGHDLLCILSRSGGPAPWVLTRGKCAGSARCGAPDREFARTAGAHRLQRRGHRGQFRPVRGRYVQKGELVRVLPEWELPPATGWAVFPGRRLMPAKTGCSWT